LKKKDYLFTFAFTTCVSINTVNIMHVKAINIMHVHAKCVSDFFVFELRLIRINNRKQHGSPSWIMVSLVFDLL
jgi:hypothetical protein